jgi:hypothetical protein
MNKKKFKELEKIVKKHFPDAKWDEDGLHWIALTKPNNNDAWEQPETLITFDKEASKKFYSYMSSNAWDDQGNIEIGVRKKIFENVIPTFEEFINENLWEAKDEEKQSTDQGPIDNEAVETGLKNKSKETGCPIGILRAVWRRGAAAWKSGHRPGAGQEQWAYARCNSFLTGAEGTWGNADSDLAKEARKAGFNPKKK